MATTKDETLAIHCSQCIEELTADTDIRDFSRLAVLVLGTQLTVCCVRHDVHIVSLLLNHPLSNLTVREYRRDDVPHGRAKLVQ